MRRIFLLSFWLILIFPFGAQAMDYWPMGDNLVYTYVNHQGKTKTVTYSDGTRTIETSYSGGINCYSSEHFSIDSNGDLWLESGTEYCTGDYHGSWWEMTPAVKFLDFPLEVGNSWMYETTTWVEPIFYICEVMSMENKTVPLGTFECIVVQELRLGGDPTVQTHYLNREFGPLTLSGGYELSSINGSVSVEESTWGGIKALYR